MGRRSATRLGAIGALFVSALTACAPVLPPQPVTVTAPIPQAIVLPEAPVSEVAAHFRGLEERRLAQGLLRTETAPRDLPFSARDLEDIFVRVALREEYTLTRTSVQQLERPAPLRRWGGPVRMGLEFGASVAPAQRAADTALVRDFARRLSGATGHPVTLGGQPNFHILVLDEAERRAAGPRLRALLPGLDALSEQIVTQMPLSVSCLVLAFARGGGNTYTDALAVVRAELPDLSRNACYFEELAQGMGLSNDSPRARPSLFNDAAEFAVLTKLDEALLALLYNPALRPGMLESEVRPLIRPLASQLLGGES